MFDNSHYNDEQFSKIFEIDEFVFYLQLHQNYQKIKNLCIITLTIGTVYIKANIKI